MITKKLFDLELASANDSYRVVMSAQGRGIVFAYEIEVAPDSFESRKLVFGGGWAYRWTWVRLCAPEMVEAYDSVVEVVGSQWAADALERLKTDRVEAKDLTLRHYMVFLDEDGCYEILAESVSIERDAASTSEGAGGWHGPRLRGHALMSNDGVDLPKIVGE